MKRTKLVLTSVGLAILMVSAFLLSDVKADSSLKKVNDKHEMTVGFCAQYPPFESKNEKTGQFEGFDVDLAQALAKEMGVKAKFMDAEWQGLLAGLKKGDYDVLITCMSKSEARGVISGEKTSQNQRIKTSQKFIRTQKSASEGSKSNTSS